MTSNYFAQAIRVRGARTHNLKNIDIDLPHGQLIVITGLSGSGKSSLAFDTLYAEGNRRFVESLSAYARQFLHMMDKPDVDSIEGLAPAISIEQKATNHNPRSTVGTITEIHDYLRLLFARVGTPYCPNHDVPLERKTVTEMVDNLFTLADDTSVSILAPIVEGKKGEYQKLLQDYIKQGYTQFRIQSGGGTKKIQAPKIYHQKDLPELKKHEKHSIEIVVDRIKINPDNATRLAQSLESAVRLGGGKVYVLVGDDAHQENQENQDKIVFNTTMSCAQCSYALDELEPRLFSFNSPKGACQECSGLGEVGMKFSFFSQQVFYFQLNDAYIHADSEEDIKKIDCPECKGSRFNKAACSVKIGAPALGIDAINRISIEECMEFFQTLMFDGQKQEIASKILHEINQRLRFLHDVGLHYLSLGRSASGLSGGEAQRIRLASQIGAGLCGVMYVLDEPSIGLHQCDNDRLIQTLKRLRDLGNTVIVVEHDEDMIRHADYVIDMGPGAGVHGGHIIAQGQVADICAHPDSITGQYLTKKRAILPNLQPKTFTETFEIKGAKSHNLKDIDVTFPVGIFTCVTGVSGSGKSTLVNDTLLIAAKDILNRETSHAPHLCSGSQGLDVFDKVINIDQSPIGRTPRSNPATYVGLFTPIRELFSQTRTAKERGYAPGRFSFNVKGGRCEACQGDGVIKVEMHFLSDVYVDCDVCKAKRYNRETLEVTYKDKNIADVLKMTVEQAHDFFSEIPTITRKLKTLLDVGLSYITLGQSAPTLSGGEAQRVKLALELSKRDTGKTLYIFDEPTTGLHFYDIEMLLEVIVRLRDKGNTIVMIEHNLDVIKTADYIIDMGPHGGKHGGTVVAAGQPADIIACADSITGRYLKPYYS